MGRRHVNSRRLLLGIITVLALCGVAVTAFFLSTGSPKRVILGRGGPQPVQIQQQQPVAIGVDSRTGDMSVLSQDRSGGVSQVTIPGSEIRRSRTTPLSEEQKPKGKPAHPAGE
jgi:hypothetical protein